MDFAGFVFTGKLCQGYNNNNNKSTCLYICICFVLTSFSYGSTVNQRWQQTVRLYMLIGLLFLNREKYYLFSMCSLKIK